MIERQPTLGERCAAVLREAKKAGPVPWEEVARLIDQCAAAQSASQIATPTQAEAQGLISCTPAALEALRVRICGWAQFRRRVTTNWTEREMKALRKVFPYDPADLELLESWYNAAESQRTYCRKDIQTLLNNWTGEMDRARQHVAEPRRLAVLR